MTDSESKTREAMLMLDVTKAINAWDMSDLPTCLEIVDAWSEEDTLYVRRFKHGKRLLDLIAATPADAIAEARAELSDDPADVAQMVLRAAEPPPAVRLEDVAPPLSVEVPPTEVADVVASPMAGTYQIVYMGVTSSPIKIGAKSDVILAAMKEVGLATE
jgi:hypothetical protein